MELDLFRLLEANPVLVLFLILGLGLLVGEIKDASLRALCIPRRSCDPVEISRGEER